MLNKEGALFVKSGIGPLFFRAMEIIEKVKALLEPIASERGYFVVDITYRREGGQFVLRIALDKEGGITMDECARLNNELGELLDKENIVDEGYLLEVSSPGLDRKLKKDSDFVWAGGKRVTVSTYAPMEGRNAFRGVLVGLGDFTGRQSFIIYADIIDEAIEVCRARIPDTGDSPDVDLIVVIAADKFNQVGRACSTVV